MSVGLSYIRATVNVFISYRTASACFAKKTACTLVLERPMSLVQDSDTVWTTEPHLVNLSHNVFLQWVSSMRNPQYYAFAHAMVTGLHSQLLIVHLCYCWTLRQKLPPLCSRFKCTLLINPRQTSMVYSLESGHIQAIDHTFTSFTSSSSRSPCYRNHGRKFIWGQSYFENLRLNGGRTKTIRSKEPVEFSANACRSWRLRS